MGHWKSVRHHCFLERLKGRGRQTLQSHSSVGVVWIPSHVMCSHSWHRSHWIMSSQLSGMLQLQNKFMQQICPLLNRADLDCLGKGVKNRFCRQESKCLRIWLWSYDMVDGSFPKASSQAKAIANSPQSTPPCCICVEGISTSRFLSLTAVR